MCVKQECREREQVKEGSSIPPAFHLIKDSFYCLSSGEEKKSKSKRQTLGLIDLVTSWAPGQSLCLSVKPEGFWGVEFSVNHLNSCRSFPKDNQDSNSMQISRSGIIYNAWQGFHSLFFFSLSGFSKFLHACISLFRHICRSQQDLGITQCLHELRNESSPSGKISFRLRLVQQCTRELFKYLTKWRVYISSRLCF